MSNLVNEERLNLDKLIKEYGADDNTSRIRELRHSKKIRDDVQIFMNLKKKYSRLELTDKNKFENIIISHCNFLWTNYTNIFNKLIKNELNINILNTFLDKLREIEDGVTDQHSASVDIGKILKEMYVDSALRHEKNIEAKENGGKTIKERKPVSNISWKKYKERVLNA